MHTHMLVGNKDDMYKNQNLMHLELQDTQALASSSGVPDDKNDSLETGHLTQHPGMAMACLWVQQRLVCLTRATSRSSYCGSQRDAKASTESYQRCL